MPEPGQTTHLLVLDAMPLGEEADLYHEIKQVPGVVTVADLTIMEEWSTMPHGVFGPQPGDIISKEEAIAQASRSQDYITPCRRDVVIIDNRTFGTVWVRMPLKQQVEERWTTWKGGIADA